MDRWRRFEFTEQPSGLCIQLSLDVSDRDLVVAITEACPQNDIPTIELVDALLEICVGDVSEGQGVGSGV